MPVRDGIDYNDIGGYNALNFTAMVAAGQAVYVTPPHVNGLGFRLGKIGGNRWVLVDGLGKVFFYKGIFRMRSSPHVLTLGTNQQNRSLLGVAQAKYAGAGTTFEQTMSNRALAWHFNSNGPVDTLSVPGLTEQPHTPASQYAKDGPIMVASGNIDPIKDIYRNVPENVPGNRWSILPSSQTDLLYRFANNVSGGQGWGDWFDPNWPVHVTTKSGYQTGGPFGGLGGNMTAGWVWEESDNLSSALGAGHTNETPGQTRGGFRPHIGMLIMWSQPIVVTQTMSRTNPSNGQVVVWTFAANNRTNYSKQQLINDLKVKYGNSIAALNAAWGTSNYYTTFDTLGGWGTNNTSLTDECGLFPRSWFGAGRGSTHRGHQTLSENNVVDSTMWGIAGQGLANAVRTDLENLARKSVVAWIKPWSDLMRARDPGVLLSHCNNGGLGDAGAPPRRFIMEALNPYVDFFTGGQHVPTGNSPHTLDQGAFTMNKIYEVCAKPTICGAYIPAAPNESSMYPWGTYTTTNVASGQYVNQRLLAPTTGIVNFRVTNGDYPYIGWLKWGMFDQKVENTAWGMCSANDNPYDGTNYTIQQPDKYAPDRLVKAGVGPGFSNEDFHYGDFLGKSGTVLNRTDLLVGANIGILAALQAQIVQAIPVADFTWTQPIGAQAIVFTDTSSGNPTITAWFWDFGDGQQLSGNDPAIHKNPTHAYATTGLKTAQHRVTNALGTSPMVSKQISVDAPQAGWAFKSSTFGQVTTATSQTLAPASIAVGNLVVVMASSNAPAPADYTVTDSLGHTYTPLSAVIPWPVGRFRSFYKIATVGGTNPSVVISVVGPAPVSNFKAEVYVAEVVGGSAAIALVGQPQTGTGTNTTGPITSGSITTTSSTLLLGLTDKTSTGDPVTTSPPFTTAGTGVIAHALNVSPGTYAFTKSYPGTASWIAQVLAFRASGGTPSTFVPLDAMAMPWTGQDLSLPGIVALGPGDLTWTGAELDVQTPTTVTVVLLVEAVMTWTGEDLTVTSLRVRRTRRQDNFDRPDGPLT